MLFTLFQRITSLVKIPIIETNLKYHQLREGLKN